MQAATRTVRVERHLKYTFNQDERNELASDLANAYYDRTELESQLASIKADFKGKIGSIEAQIEKQTRRIRDGYEMREIECEVQFHTPEEGKKRVVRIDTGEVVGIELMLPHERQEVLPFVERAPERELVFYWEGKASPVDLEQPHWGIRVKIWSLESQFTWELFLNDGQAERKEESLASTETQAEAVTHAVSTAIEMLKPYENTHFVVFSKLHQQLSELMDQEAPGVDLWPNRWPQPNENGVYSLEKAHELEWLSSENQKLCARIWTLQVGPNAWIADYEYNLQVAAKSALVSTECKRYEREDWAVVSMLARLDESIGKVVDGKLPKGLSTQIARLNSWAAAEYAKRAASERERWPQADPATGHYPDDKAERIRRDLGGGDFAEVRLLEVDEDTYQFGYLLKVGELEDVGHIGDWNEPEPRETALLLAIKALLSYSRTDYFEQTVFDGARIRDSRMALQAWRDEFPKEEDESEES